MNGWAMFRKLPADGFKWVKDLSQFNEDFIKNYDENSSKGYFLEVDVEYRKKLFNLHKDFSYLPERKKLRKIEKLVCSIEDKEEYVVHIKTLKQALNHGLILKKVHRVIQFNQKHGWNHILKRTLNSEQEQKMNLKKIFLS